MDRHKRSPDDTDNVPGKGWIDTVIYAGTDAARAVGLAQWCFGAGKRLHVVRAGFPDLIVVPYFAVTATSGWSRPFKRQVAA
jgi:hypothetical protein